MHEWMKASKDNLLLYLSLFPSNAFHETETWRQKDEHDGREQQLRHSDDNFTQ